MRLISLHATRARSAKVTRPRGDMLMRILLLSRAVDLRIQHVGNGRLVRSARRVLELLGAGIGDGLGGLDLSGAVCGAAVVVGVG